MIDPLFAFGEQDARKEGNVVWEVQRRLDLK
jgi:hypothetical protein